MNETVNSGTVGHADMSLCPVLHQNEQAKLLSHFDWIGCPVLSIWPSLSLSLSVSDAGCLFEDGVCESYEVCANGKWATLVYSSDHTSSGAVMNTSHTANPVAHFNWRLCLFMACANIVNVDGRKKNIVELKV